MSVVSGPPPDSDEVAMILFLEAVDRSRGITGYNILPWVTEVYNNL